MSTENENKDIISRQKIDWKVLKGFLNGTDKSQVNVIYVENLAVGTTTEQIVPDSMPTDLEEMLWHVLSRLPDPKLDSLQKLAMKIAIEKNDHSNKKASIWLGKGINFISGINFREKHRKEKEDED